MERLPLSKDYKLNACEDHLFYIEEYLEKISSDEAYFRPLSAALRVLVCRMRRNKPLLLDLMAEEQFEVQLHPPKPPDVPFERPFRLVREWDGESFSLATEVRPVSFREYVEDVMAVFVRQRALSYGQLTLMVANQLGGAHEDGEIDPELAFLADLEIGGVTSFVQILEGFARTTIDVGARFIEHMTHVHGYTPRRLILPRHAT